VFIKNTIYPNTKTNITKSTNITTPTAANTALSENAVILNVNRQREHTKKREISRTTQRAETAV
jgi:hypothetical protein